MKEIGKRAPTIVRPGWPNTVVYIESYCIEQSSPPSVIHNMFHREASTILYIKQTQNRHTHAHILHHDTDMQHKPAVGEPWGKKTCLPIFRAQGNMEYIEIDASKPLPLPDGQCSVGPVTSSTHTLFFAHVPGDIAHTTYYHGHRN